MAKTFHTDAAYDAFIDTCRPFDNVRTAVVFPCSDGSLKGALEGYTEDLIEPILIGPEAQIRALAEKNEVDLGYTEIIDIEDDEEAAHKAVEMVREGEAEALMKGSLHTDTLLKAVVNKTTGLRTGRRISHAFLMAVDSYHKPFIITDAAVNIYPDLMGKRDILQNSIDLFHDFADLVLKYPDNEADLRQPKVAILSAVETINPDIASTIDAAALCKMADRKQIRGAILDGPLAFDNAINLDAAITKGIESRVAGDADILLSPDLESGNMLAKQLMYLSNATSAGILLGARCPIVLTSRADGVRSRIGSCAIAALMAEAKRRNPNRE